DRRREIEECRLWPLSFPLPLWLASPKERRRKQRLRRGCRRGNRDVGLAWLDPYMGQPLMIRVELRGIEQHPGDVGQALVPFTRSGQLQHGVHFGAGRLAAEGGEEKVVDVLGTGDVAVEFLRGGYREIAGGPHMVAIEHGQRAA